MRGIRIIYVSEIPIKCSIQRYSCWRYTRINSIFIINYNIYIVYLIWCKNKIKRLCWNSVCDWTCAVNMLQRAKCAVFKKKKRLKPLVRVESPEYLFFILINYKTYCHYYVFELNLYFIVMSMFRRRYSSTWQVWNAIKINKKKDRNSLQHLCSNE